MTEKTAGSKMKLKGKPKCPLCGKPLIFVYEGSIGFSGVKCKRCNQQFLVNTDTLEVSREPTKAS